LLLHAQIRVWRIELDGWDDDEWLVQTGQFVCEAGCASLAVEGDTVLAGDTLGRAYVLQHSAIGLVTL
jgi:hypothetical protein